MKSVPPRRKLFLALGLYRVLALAAIIGLLLDTDEGRLSGLDTVVLVILAVGTAAYFFLFNHRNYLYFLLAVEWFVVMYLPYIESINFMELVWLPGSIVTIAVLQKKPQFLILTSAIGIAFPLFFSWGYNEGVTFPVGILRLPYYIFSLFYFCPLTAFSAALSLALMAARKRYDEDAFLKEEVRRLNEINHAVSRRLFSLQNDAAHEERNRLSKEIHDTAGYIFVNLIMMLQAAQAVMRKPGQEEKAQKLVGDARDYADRGINEIRHLLRGVRAYKPVRLSLQNEIHDAAASFQDATDVEVSVDYGAWPPSFGPERDSFFVSFVEEALTNALKHGRASRAEIQCWKAGGWTGISVRNNGARLPSPLTRGIGITAMEDAAETMNGEIRIANDASGVGVKISAVFPATPLTA
jgi:signal transduction histidine kinase